MVESRLRPSSVLELTRAMLRMLEKSSTIGVLPGRKGINAQPRNRLKTTRPGAVTILGIQLTGVVSKPRLKGQHTTKRKLLPLTRPIAKIPTWKEWKLVLWIYRGGSAKWPRTWAAVLSMTMPILRPCQHSPSGSPGSLSRVYLNNRIFSCTMALDV